MSQLFKDGELDLAPPKVQQLTINFRSHGKILDLANSVVSVIETLFPQTIDHLAKEKSTTDGPMPLVIQGSNFQHLLVVLFGTEKSKALEYE